MLPIYIKPLSDSLGVHEITFLKNKSALDTPGVELRDELVRCYAEFVHPFMPLLDLHNFFTTIEGKESGNQISLFLFQAVMFSGVAFIDMNRLEKAGYASRRDARRKFFLKARLLHDFDCELDRISSIQALLLMTDWQEATDNHKESYHWMGVAASLFRNNDLRQHITGLHSQTSTKQQQLWRRIWWSAFIRDRLIAFGMRRPAQLVVDLNIPMLKLDDFNIASPPAESSHTGRNWTQSYSADKQRHFAVLCIEKIKLCICINNISSTHYPSVSNTYISLSPKGNVRVTRFAYDKSANASGVRMDIIRHCDKELKSWEKRLPDIARYVAPSHSDIQGGQESMILNRSLLHLDYYSAVSALHKPLAFPAVEERCCEPSVGDFRGSRVSAYEAAHEVTAIMDNLDDLGLIKYLPTTAITVLLTATIVNLSKIKSSTGDICLESLFDLCQCMQVMNRLRDTYAAADRGTTLLEAVIRKAEPPSPRCRYDVGGSNSHITNLQDLTDAVFYLKLAKAWP